MLAQHPDRLLGQAPAGTLAQAARLSGVPVRIMPSCSQGPLPHSRCTCSLPSSCHRRLSTGFLRMPAALPVSHAFCLTQAPLEREALLLSQLLTDAYSWMWAELYWASILRTI